VTALTNGYLATAAAAVSLLAEPAIARRWETPSVLPGMSVGALSGHLARQIFSVNALLAQPATDQRPVPLLAHYARVDSIDAGPDHESNAVIRRDAAAEAAQGPAALAARARAAARRLGDTLASEPPDRVVSLPWTS
jgi:Mycothiol maleylpyruvate isomerase N-terminal domain